MTAWRADWRTGSGRQASPANRRCGEPDSSLCFTRESSRRRPLGVDLIIALRWRYVEWTMGDAADPTRLNRALIETIKRRGFLKSPAFEEAFRTVLRHTLLPPTIPLEDAYADKAIVLKRAVDDVFLPRGTCRSSSSTPSLLAGIMEAASLSRGQSVLHVGSGPGYLDALLSRVVSESGAVVTLEIDEEIGSETLRRLQALGYTNVRSVVGDGVFGYPQMAPFDTIVATAACADVPQAWIEQLKEGGVVVLPLAFAQMTNLCPLVALRKRGNRLSGGVVGSLPVVAFVPLYGENVLVPLRPEKAASELEKSVGLWKARKLGGPERTRVRYVAEMLLLAEAIQANEGNLAKIRPREIIEAVEAFADRNKRLKVASFELVLTSDHTERDERPTDYDWHFPKGPHDLYVTVRPAGREVRTYRSS